MFIFKKIIIFDVYNRIFLYIYLSIKYRYNDKRKEISKSPPEGVECVSGTVDFGNRKNTNFCFWWENLMFKK